MSTESSRRAVNTFRQRIGEAAFAEHMARLRATRKKFGHFEHDYVAPDGRTGPEIAAEAGRRGKRGKSKHKQETT